MAASTQVPKSVIGPHQAISSNSPRERFTTELFDTLWDRYRTRVTHVGTYERVIRDAGATFVNDHIAFRTLAVQKPLTGIPSVSRVFEALGYRSAGCYNFSDKHLSAIHFQHANPGFPKRTMSRRSTRKVNTPRGCWCMATTSTTSPR